VFVDSHAHLEGPRFDADRDQVFRRAAEAGIDTILLIGSGTGPGSLDCAIQLADARSPKNPPALYATIGVHPHEAGQVSDSDYHELSRLAPHPRVIAWGEIGLDYYYDHSRREVQRTVFVRQMELARAARLPIVIHCRPSDNSENAWGDCLALLAEHWTASGLGGVLHCFTGTLAHARSALDMGFMLSFAGNITFPKAQDIRDAAREAPLDRIFIETDSPFLAPVPYRGKRNEPAFVRETARQIGELRAMSAEEVGALTAENFRRFFQLQS
jgi:TatD DNase family protein